MSTDIRIVAANNRDLLEKAFQVRREVFVVEQEVVEPEEFDEFEDISHHFVALDPEGNPIGASRWRTTNKGIKLERFAVKKNQRGKGLGTLLVDATLEDISKNVDKGTYLYMHSQLNAVPLYEKFGFQKAGDQFDECGILHYFMWKEL